MCLSMLKHLPDRTPNPYMREFLYERFTQCCRDSGRDLYNKPATPGSIEGAGVGKGGKARTEDRELCVELMQVACKCRNV